MKISRVSVLRILNALEGLPTVGDVDRAMELLDREEIEAIREWADETGREEHIAAGFFGSMADHIAMKEDFVG